MALMQDDRGSGGNLPIAGILALLLFTSGLLVHHQPLQSDRPGISGQQDKPFKDPQVIESRLWQDPFDAVQRQEKEQKASSGTASCTNNCPSATAVPAADSSRGALRDPLGNPHGYWVSGQSSKPGMGGASPGDIHGAKAFRELLERRDEADRTLILPVMVYGGPYAEDVEGRRRTRYAVLSALRAAEYQPVNNRAIGYVRIGREGGNLDGLTVPFERWVRIDPRSPDRTLDLKASRGAQREHAWDSVIVLWLKEEWFSKKADESFKSLFAQLLPETLVFSQSQIKVIGPASPETAESLHGDIPLPNCPPRDRVQINSRCVDFISPSLTEPAAREKYQIARMNPTDDVLAAAIIDELHRRGIDIPSSQASGASCDDHLVLVVESDTHYGRSLERQFRKQLAACRPDAPKAERRLHIYRYFRGMDGKVAAGQDGEKKKSDKASAGTPERTAPEERAEGDGQFDYLLRVAGALREKDDEIALDEQDRIRGVVVLGTDIYDKLAVFHALREKLPQAVFATNDLDAGLFDRDQLSWTRNVVVASGYGLNLPSSLRSGAASFRDSYQSATFLAARYALAPPDGSPSGLVKKIDDRRGQVHLFEIGNGIPVRLDRKRAVDNALQAWWPLGLPLLTLALLAVVHSWCARDALARHWRIFFVAALALAGYAQLVLWVAGRPGEEPLSWQEGVSAWPTEFIRLLVILLALFALYRVISGLSAGDRALEKDFFARQQGPANPAPAGPQPAAAASWPRRLKAFVVGRWQCFPKAPRSHTSRDIDVARLWNRYRGWVAPGSEATRVGLGFGFFFAFTIVTAILEHPVSPIRGSWSFAIDRVTWWLAFVATSVLTIYILDRVAMATLFLQELYGGRDRARSSQWEQIGVIDRYCGFPVADRDHRPSAIAIRSYVDLRLSAQFTAYVGRIVLYPFFLTLLLILARSRYFDNWVMPRGLLSVFVVALLLVTFAAFALRYSAERIRRHTIERLIEAETSLRAGDGKQHTADAGATPEQLKLMRDNAGNLREGAFAPISEQPIVRALVLPFGGAGVVKLVDWALFMRW